MERLLAVVLEQEVHIMAGGMEAADYASAV